MKTRASGTVGRCLRHKKMIWLAAIFLLVFSSQIRAESGVPSGLSNSLTSLPLLTASSQSQSWLGGPFQAPSRLLTGYEGGAYFIYPYAILKVPLWGNLDNGWTFKLAGDGLMYEFNAGPAGKIRATAPSAETLVGYSLTRELGGFSLLIGPQYRHTYYNKGFQGSHHYDDVGFKSEGTLSGHWGSILGASDIVHSTVTGSYTTVNRFYRLQGRPLLFGARTGHSSDLRQRCSVIRTSGVNNTDWS